MTVTETLRQAVESCGLTRAELSRTTGVTESVLSRFVQNGQGLRSDNIDALCKHLGLRLTADKKPNAGKARNKGR